jgi:chemotaxis protein methyltransferase WspC
MLSRVKQWLVEHAGLDPELLQRDWLDRVIQRRLNELDQPGEAAYCLLLDQDPAERDRIIREVSVGETSFFRYPASYELLVQHLQQMRRRLDGRGSLRMLSVACATGQEPYSMAIAALHAGWPSGSVIVDAVDRNADVLAVARTARYPLRSDREQCPAWAAAWLRVESRQVCVAPAIRSAVHFLQADVVAPSASLLPGRYAVVFCRNLLIYLHDQARRRLIDQLAGWLDPDGLLFVGHAELVELARARFQPVSWSGAFALRHTDADSPQSVLPSVPMVSRPRAGVQASAASAAGPNPAIPGTTPACDLDHVAHPTSTEISLLEQARSAADQGLLDTALDTIGTALQSRGPSAELYQLLGSVQLSSGRLPEARDALRRAVYLDPEHEQALLQLAIIYRQLGDESRAALYHKRAARVHQEQQAGSPGRGVHESETRAT